MAHRYLKLFFIIALILTNLAIFSSSVNAQWSIPGDTVGAFAVTSIGNVVISAKAGVSYSTNFGSTWNFTVNGLPYESWISDYARGLYTKGSAVFLGINVKGTPVGSVGVYKSLDSGKSWAPSANGMLNGTLVYCFTQKDGNIFAGTEDGVYMSTNDGANWFKPSTVLDEKSISCLCVNGNTLFAGILGASVTTNLGIYASTNNGQTWNLVNYGIPPQTPIYAMVNYNGYVFSTASDGRVFRTTNNGASWILLNDGITTFYNRVYAIAKFGNNMIVGTEDGIFLTSNQGAHWVSHNQGVRDDAEFDYNAITQCGNYVFAVSNIGIYRRDLNQVSIQNISTIASQNYKLEQNYPNPFNPTTKIRFELPKSSFVSLKIYNSLGKEVDELVNQKLSAGIFEETFNASMLSSGVYFYKLAADDFVETKKMLLVK